MPRFAKAVAASDAAAAAPNAYEAERAARIAANKARMAQLGILDTSRAIADAANAERLAARNARAGSSAARGNTSNGRGRRRRCFSPPYALRGSHGLHSLRVSDWFHGRGSNWCFDCHITTWKVPTLECQPYSAAGPSRPTSGARRPR
jgi:hypothetical protein